jgi:thiol:disulfide interchange protein
MRNFLLLLALFISLPGFSQMLTPVKWSMEYKQVNDTEYDLIFTAKIDNGWGIYSQFLDSDEGPVATEFTYDAGSHFQKKGKTEESGNRKKEYDTVFEMDVVKFTKTGIFTQRVKLLEPGKPITGYLTFMTCDDTRCLPPTDVDFEFLLQPKDAKPGDNKTGAAEQKSETQVAETAQKDAPAFTVDANASESAATSESGLLDPIRWAYSMEETDEDGVYVLKFTATPASGWALYSQHTPDGGPIPTAFYFEPAEGLELLGNVNELSAVKKAPDPLFGGLEVVKFVESPILFEQRVRLANPEQVVTGYVEYMTCDDEQCIPMDKDFRFSLSGSGDISLPVRALVDRAALEGTPVAFDFEYDWAETVCADNKPPVDERPTGLWLIFLLGFGGGLLALITPCVFPMVPLTVSFFTKTSTTRAKGIRNALWYGASIIVIYLILGLAITAAFGADALNLLSTNAWFNIFFALLFIIFAFSFFGYFEITLPSSWANKSDKAAERGGLIGIFFMAFTLSLVSFSCTGPIIGTLLVETATGQGATILGRIPVNPLMGMFGFSVALALPFGLFAAFPSWLHSLPRSGSWMTEVKVVLGFIEIALAMKFLSIADLTMGWKIMPYELFVAIWVLCAIGLALYFAGIIRFPHDSPVKKFGPGRVSLIAFSLLMAGYFTWGFRYSEQAGTFATPNLLSGLAPPAGHSYIYPKKCPLNIDCYKDFYDGLSYAKKVGKPVLIDFTGHGCVNCRRMEDNVWGESGIYELLRDDYVLISLYVDDREKLDEPYTSPLSGKAMRTVGNRWADFQAIHFNRNSQPYYVLMSEDGKVLNQPVAYTPDKQEYQAFLECGLERYAEHKRNLIGARSNGE